ncbi:hypothetical protein M0R04_05740 [Candidatus Dojkabacteria bacterium]|nr:hypothetical protein [Candidatus Dojkabacteria bacterium]
MLLKNWFDYYEWVTGPDGPHPDADTVEDPDRLDTFVSKWKRDQTKGKNAKSWSQTD